MAKRKEKSAFVVTGSSGEWEDYVQWPVAAYTDLAKAQQHRDLAQSRATPGGLSSDEREAFLSPWDPRMHCNAARNGVKYCVREIPLLSSVPRSAFTRES